MALAGLIPNPRFASGRVSNYLGAMPLFLRPGRTPFYPRAASPRSALADLKLMFAPDRPYRWTFLTLSAAICGLIIWGFYQEFQAPTPERQIIYIKSYPAGRKDSDIIRQQIADLANYETQLEESQQQYQRLADSVGIEWRKEADENRAHRAATMAEMKKRLEKKLDEALVKEAATGNGAESPSTDPKTL